MKRLFGFVLSCFVLLMSSGCAIPIAKVIINSNELPSYVQYAPMEQFGPYLRRRTQAERDLKIRYIELDVISIDGVGVPIVGQSFTGKRLVEVPGGSRNIKAILTAHKQNIGDAFIKGAIGYEVPKLVVNRVERSQSENLRPGTTYRLTPYVDGLQKWHFELKEKK